MRTVVLLVGLVVYAIITYLVDQTGRGTVIVIAVLAAVAAAIMFTLTISSRHRDIRMSLAQTREDPGERLRRRINRVNQAFAEAADLMSELERDLQAQQAARDALLAEAEQQQQLLEVNQEQAERIRQILMGETKATIRAERRQQWMFFTLGVLVSIPIGVAINLLVP